MSLDDHLLNLVWVALHCGDHEFLREMLPSKDDLERKLKYSEGQNELGLDNDELLVEFASNYWNERDTKERNQTVVVSENGLLRCVIWPQSSFSFEGRAFLTKLDVDSERLFSANIHSFTKSENSLDREISSPLMLQGYSGQWRFEGSHIIAEVTSGDFGVLTIEAILKPTKDGAARPEFLSDIERLLNKLSK